LGYVILNQKFSLTRYFVIIDKVASWARFVPWAIVWRPLVEKAELPEVAENCGVSRPLGLAAP